MKNLVINIFLFTGIIYSFNATAQNDAEGKRKKNDAAVNSNKKTPVKYIEYIVGTWTVAGIYKNNKDISKTDTVAEENQIMEFTREGKYMSYAGSEKIDSGLYRVNEGLATLYLESEAKGNPTEWTVTFNKNEMILQNKQTSARAERLKYIYSRKSNKPTH